MKGGLYLLRLNERALKPVRRLEEPMSKPGREQATYPPDPVFFTKEQIRVGVRLQCVGRRKRQVWVVTRIISKLDNEHGRAQAVRYTTDAVRMRLEGTRQDRTASFAYLCYSAIWRIHKGR